MSKAAVLLRDYLQEIGFSGIFKYLAGINNYILSPHRVNDKSELKPGHIDFIIERGSQSLNLLKCLVIAAEMDYDKLDAKEQKIADALIDEGFIGCKDSKIYNTGYQLISYCGIYFLIDGRINYRKLGNHDSYIGIDTYLMLYYLETERIGKNSKCLDLCTGSGISALYLSNFSDNVVGTDIAQLPLKLSQFNCILNNRESKLVIKNEDFNLTISQDIEYDVITCNPPFVAFPADLEAPIFAKGYDEDGLGHYRRLFSRMNNILSKDGFACFVSDFIGDENEPYFSDELREYCEKYGLRMDLFIDNQLDAEEQLAVYPYYLHKFNTNYSIEEVEKKSNDFIRNKMKAGYYYLSTLLIRLDKANPVLRSFKRYKKASSNEKEFNYFEVFK